MAVLLSIHIVAAALGLVTGAIALSVSKGATLHRKSGLLFVYAIATMCASAVVMALIKVQVTNVIGGLTTAYLAITALTTVRKPSAGSRSRDVGLMLLALVLGATTVTFGLQAALSASGEKFGYPPYPFFLLGSIGLIGGVGDLQMIRKGGLRGAPRLARHLWRMCWALFITAASFFSIRARVARVLPAPFTTPALRALPVLLVLLAMVYWLWRVRSKRAPHRVASIIQAA